MIGPFRKRTWATGSSRAACGTDEAAAREAARSLLDARVTWGGETFGVALSGGRIAASFYGCLVAQSARRGVDLRKVDYFWADERCVPPDHADSNYRTARETLLGPLGVAPERVHRLEGEREPAEAVVRAVSDWRRWQALQHSAPAAPQVVVLGVGEDGHVASLFPGNLGADLRVDAPFATVVGPKPPPQRLTMTYPMLWQAPLVIVLATGEGKGAVVDAALAGSPDLPLTRVLAGRRARLTHLFTR
ncbi:MAG: 6-phosphogluconolactonase [Verrucomicrobiales bacterium]|nr:6-phosphogluconolactonase [Verrucomicrobiales bacterium]